MRGAKLKELLVVGRFNNSLPFLPAYRLHLPPISVIGNQLSFVSHHGTYSKAVSFSPIYISSEFIYQLVNWF